MTEETPQQSKARYHIEQFVKQTEPDEREGLLREYGLKEDGEGPTPKAVETEPIPEDADLDKWEEIVVSEARKRGYEVLEIGTGPSEYDEVEENVDAKLRLNGHVIETSFVKERSDDAELVEPVTEEWFRESVEKMLDYKSGDLS